MKTAHVARRLGMPKRTAAYWAESDLLEVSIPAQGRGTERDWSVGDCVRASAVKWLRQFTSIQRIRERGVVDEITDQAIRRGDVLTFDASDGSMGVMTQGDLSHNESYTIPGHRRLRFRLDAAAEWWRRH